MARIGKAQRALDRAHEHRQKIEQLLAEPDCLRPWFLDWAESQLKRDRFYIYSETEHAVLERELERLKPYRGFAGYGIDELLRAATGYCADCDLDDQEFLERLNRRQPPQLPQWQLLHLVGICRHVAGLDVPFQEDLEAALTVAA